MVVVPFQQALQVAPHAGAWIETVATFLSHFPSFVAPHAGAWIETDTQLSQVMGLASRTPRGCVD